MSKRQKLIRTPDEGIYKDDIVDDLTSTDTDKPLSANMGKALNEKFKVLQVVQNTTSTTVSVSSNTYTDTGLTASITPSSVDSKILVFVGQLITISRPDDDTAGGGLRLMRGSTEIYLPSYRDGTGDIILWGRQTGSGASLAQYRSFISFQYLDSPNSLSEQSYKTQIKRFSSGLIITQEQGATSTIILVEIAG